MNRTFTIFATLAFILAFTWLGAQEDEKDPVYLGFHLQQVDQEVAKRVGLEAPTGLLIGDVVPGSPADLAKVPSQAILLSLAGRDLPAGAEAMTTLRALLDEVKQGEALKAVLWIPPSPAGAPGERREVTITPVSRRAWQNQETRILADSIIERITELRGLEAKKNVDISMFSREGLVRHLRAEIERDTIISDLKKLDILMGRLGAQPEDVNTIELTLNFLQMGVAGFYDPKIKSLVLMAGQSEEQNEATMAHELVHMIQDQHFNLRALMEGVPYNSDKTYIIRCLAEGDAKVLELEYARKFLGRDDSGQWLAEQKHGGSFVPPSLSPDQRYLMILTKAILSPYTLGGHFVAEAHRRGGWDAVNRLYHDFPASTEQILHPEKYFDLDQRDEPIEVDLDNFIDWADDGGRWEVVVNDVVGELATSWLFLNFVNRKVIDAESAAAGWGGDRLVGLLDPKTQEPVIVWLSVWDDEAQAKEFEEALKTLYQHRFASPETPEGESPEPRVVAVDDEGRITRLERWGNRILLVDGARAEVAQDLATRAAASAQLQRVQRQPFWAGLTLPEDRVKLQLPTPAEVEEE